MTALPRKPDLANVNDLKALAMKTFMAFSDVIEFLRLLPVIKVKVWQGALEDLPITLDLRLPNVAPTAVLIGKMYALDDPTEVLTPKSVHWWASDDSASPGVVVADIDSVASNRQYAVHFVVLGER